MGGGGDDGQEADRALFRAAMRGVRKLRPEPRGSAAPARPRGGARFARADRVAVLAESIADLDQPLAPVAETGAELQYRRNGVPEQVFRKLRGGQYRIEAELDLHGLTAAQARNELANFLALALQREWRVLRIVHGKGLRSGNRGPVLRLLVDDYLRRVSVVLAFANAREVDGGTGATLVLLASKRRRGA